MKLLLTFLLLFNFVTVQATENPVTEFSGAFENHSGNEQPKSPLYPHRAGIRNHKSNCYLNALVSCLYAVPFFQNAVYDAIRELPEHPPKSKSVLMSLGDIFVKMRLNKSPVGISTTMLPAVKHEMDWSVGQYRCVLEFWTNIIDKMPENFQNICKIQLKLNYSRKSDGLLITSAEEETNYIDIPTPKELMYVSNFVASQFLDMETEDFVIEPEFQGEYSHLLAGPISEKAYIPMFNTMTIENTPNVLVFNVKRQGWNRESGEFLNSVPVIFDDFVLKGEKYVPLCAVLYNGENEHYYAILHDSDVGRFFVHNDTKITEIDPENPSEVESFKYNLLTRSTMAFYVKQSAFEAIKSEMIPLIRENKDIPQVLVETAKTKISKKRSIDESHKKKTKRSKIEDADLSENSDNETHVDDNEDKNVADAVVDDLSVPELSENSDNETHVDDNEDKNVADAVVDDLSVSSTYINSSIDPNVGDEYYDIDLKFISGNQSNAPNISNPFDFDRLEYPLFDLSPETPEQQSQIHKQQNDQESHQHQHQPQQKTIECQTETLDISTLSILSDRHAVLGMKDFKFSDSDPSSKSFALELVLTAFASNSYILKGLFSIISEHEKSKFEFQLAIVLVQMLAGEKKISLARIVGILKDFGAKKKILDIQSGQLETKIFNILEMFCSLLNNSIMNAPSLRSIVYSELITDEPIHISHTNSIFYRVTPSILIPPRKGKFPGVFFDKILGENRCRTILTSNSLMFPIIIERAKMGSRMDTIDNSKFVPISDEFLVIGSIFYGDSRDRSCFHAEFVNNYIPNSTISLTRTNGGIINHYSSACIADRYAKLFNASQTDSHIIFVIKKDCWKIKPVKVAEIPKFLLDEIISTSTLPTQNSQLTPSVQNISDQSKQNGYSIQIGQSSGLIEEEMITIEEIESFF